MAIEARGEPAGRAGRREAGANARDDADAEDAAAAGACACANADAPGRATRGASARRRWW